MEPRLTKPGSRTWVTELPSTPRYRFFPECVRKMGHAALPHWNILCPPALGAATRLSDLLVRFRPSFAGRHAFSAAPYSHRRLLLPLRRIESSRRLCEDVRLKAIRISLEGCQLRETSHEHAAARLACRPAFSPSRPRRTRRTPALEYFLCPHCSRCRSNLRLAAWHERPALRGRPRDYFCQPQRFLYPPTRASVKSARFSNP